MRKYYFFTILATALLFTACKDGILGNLLPNKAPDTHTIIEVINRSGGTRFPSSVKIQWWGDDPDGYVQSYQYTFDYPVTASANWHAITGNDSLFSLTTPAGIDTADFHFSIRAIDNEGLVDPTPASVAYPVKNSNPSVQFMPGIYNPTRTFPVVRLYWQGTDPDGADNIAGYEMVWNDTTQAALELGPTVSSIILEGQNWTGSTTICNVYTNNNTSTPSSKTLAGMKLNANNNCYIRIKDISGAYSHWVASYSMFIKKPNSTKLLVDAYTNTSATALNFYSNRMINQNYTDCDTLKLFEKVGGVYSQLSADNATQSKILKYFKLIVWFGDNTGNSLFLAQKSLNDFFTGGGKLFMAMPMDKLFSGSSPSLAFTPASSLTEYKDSTIIYSTDSLSTSSLSGYPVLKNSNYTQNIKPFVLAPNAYAIYTANLNYQNVSSPIFPIPAWHGPSCIMAGLKNAATLQTIMVYSQVDLQTLNASSNIDLAWATILQTLGY
ncbi:MAG: hypothetical protein RL138_301 [Bacteroidota bacterium]